MRFKTSLTKEPKHTDFVSAVGWSNTDEAFSCGDDHKVIKWSLVTNETSIVADLPNDLFPTCMHWNSRGMGKKSTSDIFLLPSTDGKFHFVNRNGNIEKSVDGHEGAVCSGAWSYDGSGLATGGEDGRLKVWSRNGMLRSSLAQVPSPIYSLAWSPNSSQILFTNGRNLIIRPLAPNSKPIQWKAHEGIVLTVAWNVANNTIASGSEDCRYKLWDCCGRLLFSSPQYDYPITSVAWSPNGEMFAVGSFNTLRLCSKIGWSYSLDKPLTGSVYSLCWSSDGTQVVGGCANGHVLFAHVIEQCLEWKKYVATVTSRKSITVCDVTDETTDKLDFRDCIIQVALGFDHLVVATSTQCHIYNTRNWNTPTIFDLKDGNVHLLLPAERYFLLVEGSQIGIHSYEGRSISNIRWPGMQVETLAIASISLSNDTIAVRDFVDEKNIHLFDAMSGKSLNDGRPYTHPSEVVEVALDQAGSPNQRRMAIIDKNRDIHLLLVRRYGAILKPHKFGVMVYSMCWNIEYNILSAIQDSGLTIWYYPAVVAVDRNLLARSTMNKNTIDLGKNPVVVSFIDNHVNILRSDGSVINIRVSSFPAILHSHVSSQKWENAVRLCRTIKDDALWSCLAGMALVGKELSVAETAYAALGEADRVLYLQKIKSITNPALQTAEMVLLSGNSQDAEAQLIQAGLVFRAIMLNIHLYFWDRALDLAIKQGNHIDTVLAYRQRYLNRMEKTETLPKFLGYEGKMDTDWDAIAMKDQEEYQNAGMTLDTYSQEFTF